MRSPAIRGVASGAARSRGPIAPELTPAGAAAVREIVVGLLADQSFLAPKFFYDELGSVLFEAITALPEYYPTRVERALLARYSSSIASLFDAGGALIDLGAGNCRKARTLFPVLGPRQYVAVDISAAFVRQALTEVSHEFPALETLAVEADFTRGLVLPAAVRAERRLFFYPGSSIGNFAPDEAARFLGTIRTLCGTAGALLIGIDLIKPRPLLEAAYDDDLGVTAAFNRNILNHVNRLIHSDFALRDWAHRAYFNAARSRVEMHLEACRDTVITWPGGQRGFRRGETIHTENSYKFAIPDFERLLHGAGFARQRYWTDERRWFALCLAFPQ